MKYEMFMRSVKCHLEWMKNKKWLLAILCIIALCAGGCSYNNSGSAAKTDTQQSDTNTYEDVGQESNLSDAIAINDVNHASDYVGEPYAVVNGGMPEFSDEDKKSVDPFETYSELDKLGRCGVAYANICTDLMPVEERGAIGQVKPSGWKTVKYNDLIEGNYLYNRCHLIGYQLAAENANESNLITGTRYLNTTGMLEFENDVCAYVKETGNHVLYRVTPWFAGNNLVADGVQMEAWSVEDSGAGICFNVFCYNVQPGIKIDYLTGDSEIDEAYLASSDDASIDGEGSEKHEYVANKNTKKFHMKDCASVNSMSENNKLIINGTYEELINLGYEPCKNCLK